MLAYFSQPRGDIGVVITKSQAQMTQYHESVISIQAHHPTPAYPCDKSVQHQGAERHTSQCGVISQHSFPSHRILTGMIIGYSSPVLTSVSRSPTFAHAGCLLNVAHNLKSFEIQEFQMLTEPVLALTSALQSCNKPLSARAQLC
jgi:hypothetical protein